MIRFFLLWFAFISIFYAVIQFGSQINPELFGIEQYRYAEKYTKQHDANFDDIPKGKCHDSALARIKFTTNAKPEFTAKSENIDEIKYDKIEYICTRKNIRYYYIISFFLFLSLIITASSYKYFFGVRNA